ncbi:WHG domain-containing protein [Streptomyces sp. NPDC008125]|uniref:TetR/AcrR family transcriptional regulator n=1 Tax=Streptomyces sp. NPDC008125 TaxID=3364811 RepID=UPI0036E8FB29
MSAIKGARERARTEITAAIKDEARAQLAAEGASRLSLRAVARELGMVSSALYRYFPSRDELLTALIIDAYDAIGEAAEKAVRDATASQDGSSVTASPDGSSATAWTAVACAVRKWALAHPHEYALIHGSPVPGYVAPQDTVGPASRVGMALIGLIREAHRGECLATPPLSAALRPEAVRMAAELAPDLPPANAAALVIAWAQLFGLVSFEVFGQFNGVVVDRETLFRQAADGLAHSVGLTVPGELSEG